jgi:hypothetical protein
VTRNPVLGRQDAILHPTMARGAFIVLLCVAALAGAQAYSCNDRVRVSGLGQHGGATVARAGARGAVGCACRAGLGWCLACSDRVAPQRVRPRPPAVRRTPRCGVAS